ncbi:MAG: hypothetical protein WC637_06060 [Victivallales bacterium]|jgi:hypothetical protein
MDGWLDEWMIGFEFKENLKGLSYMKKTKKLFCEFITGLFYAYVFDTQPSSNPFIQSSMGRQWMDFVKEY